MTISSASIALAFNSGISASSRAARVAAGIGDEPRRLDLAPIDFGQAVDRVLLQLRRGVGVAVPARISRRIGETEVGRKIDDLGRRRLRQQILDHLLRRAVRQRAERKIEPERCPVVAIERRQASARSYGRELRKHVRHRLAGAAIGGEQHDLRARMAQTAAAPVRHRYSRRRRARRFWPFFLPQASFNPRYDCWGLKHKASVRGKIFGEGGAAAPAARFFTRERALVPSTKRRRRRRNAPATVTEDLVMGGDIGPRRASVNLGGGPGLVRVAGPFMLCRANGIVEG